ncbi:hypothetical protein C8R46DRAFT_1062577 [Mycena filopes]|nr:hypothetical protein C8R46DRAFT_1062577 [Mycena filopes]
MSSKAITAATNHFLQFRLQYASLALIYYDFALTLPKEVRYVWEERFRLSTALYIGCRYALVANILFLLAISGKLGSTCDSWYKIVGALSILGRAAVITVFTLRTYAVYGQNKWVLAYMGTLGLACVALDITHVPGMRCVGSSSLPMSPQLLSVLMVVFEASSAFLTTGRCIAAFRAGGLKNQRHGILFLLFEKGILYFCVIAIFTTTAVILNYRAPPGFLQRLPNAFTLPLSCLLTARFILYLREWDAEQLGNKGRATDLTIGDFNFSNDLNIHSTSTAATRIAGVLAVQDFGADPMEAPPDAQRDESESDLEANVFQRRKVEQTGLGDDLDEGRRRSSDSSIERGYGMV